MRLLREKNWIAPLICVAMVINLFLYSIINQREDLVEGWDINTSRNISSYILSNSSLLYLKPNNFCEKPVFLLFFVISSLSNIAARNAIRQSWALPETALGKSMKTYFLLGDTFNLTIQEEIEKESKQYNDIIQGNFIDSYNNLTIKSVAMLNLVHFYCRNTTSYIMKCDDDTFVNTKLLMKTLTSSPKTNFLTGILICHAKPIKNSNNKWYAPNYLFSGKVYPDYLSGSGYLFSSDVASTLYSVALKTPLFYLEDVYITGICASSANLARLHNPNFRYEKETINSCTGKYVITSHRVSPKDMRNFYSAIQNTNVTNCKINKPTKKRKCSS